MKGNKQTTTTKKRLQTSTTIRTANEKSNLRKKMLRCFLKNLNDEI